MQTGSGVSFCGNLSKFFIGLFTAVAPPLFFKSTLERVSNSAINGTDKVKTVYKKFKLCVYYSDQNTQLPDYYCER